LYASWCSDFCSSGNARLEQPARTFALFEYLILPTPLFIATLYAVIDIGAPAWRRIMLPTFIFVVPTGFVLACITQIQTPLRSR